MKQECRKSLRLFRLALPTTMAFLSQNDILVLEKDKGTVMRVIDGEVQPQPLLNVNVATEVERCMCGIAVSQSNETGIDAATTS
jgi:aldose sugar dehydrogenase